MLFKKNKMLNLLQAILPKEIKTISFAYDARCFGNIVVVLSAPDGKHMFTSDRGEIYHNGKMLCDSAYLWSEKTDTFSKMLQIIKHELKF